MSSPNLNEDVKNNIRNLIKFIDTQLNSNGDITPNYLQNLLINTCESNILNAIITFCQENDNAWISDNQMDLTKCKTKVLVMKDKANNEITISLEDIFRRLSEVAQARFWIWICLLCQRTPEQLQTQQRIKFEKAALDFQNDLAAINIFLSVEDILTLVKNNMEAIRLRLFPSLVPQLAIDEINQNAFWAHMENIYNILNPYNKLKFESNEVVQLVSGVMNKMTNISPNDFTDTNSIIQKMGSIITPDMMKMITDIVTGGKLGEVFQSLVPSLQQQQ